MAESIEAKEIGAEPSMALRLWLGILISPIAWAIQLQTLWLTSEYACLQSGDFTWNHVVSAFAMAISAAGIVIAFLEYRKWNPAGDNTRGEPTSRRRFMSMAGLVGSVFFTIVIFALWLPTIVGVPCSK